MFVFPTNLHCSQTRITWDIFLQQFVSPTNLHCSQTLSTSLSPLFSLFPLRIYTALKHPDKAFFDSQVCFPYEFTLLSNHPMNAYIMIPFVSPTNLHCSQTMFGCFLVVTLFVSPTNLHCSQTCRVYYFSGNRFVSPTNLHCSQTCRVYYFSGNRFVSPTNLHCSQTIVCGYALFFSLFPLRIYTALKLIHAHCVSVDSLFPLRIYTALKLVPVIVGICLCLFPLRIYTALKLLK